jgi:hypothetical protein
MTDEKHDKEERLLALYWPRRYCNAPPSYFANQKIIYALLKDESNSTVISTD